MGSREAAESKERIASEKGDREAAGSLDKQAAARTSQAAARAWAAYGGGDRQGSEEHATAARP